MTQPSSKVAFLERHVMRCFIGPRGQCHPRRGNTHSLFDASSSSSFPFSTSSSHSRETPSKRTSSWERSAKLVKDTDLTNPYLEQVRSEVVDPALQLKTIEDELCAAIGKALGRQGEKVRFAINEMKEERTQCLRYIGNRSFDEALQSAQRHNEARKRAINARWELLVHRQAVGFTVDNHRVVHTTFPIDEALPAKIEELMAMVSSDEGDSMTSSVVDPTTVEQPEKKVWGDQLSWWERVGRWR